MRRDKKLEERDPNKGNSIKHRDARERRRMQGPGPKKEETAYNQEGLGRAFTVIDGSVRNSVVDFEDKG